MTVDSGGPRSRRERPAKPALTRSGIIAAAVGMLRAEGMPRLTMRRLAQQLDTGPASLYVYVRNTAELHAAVLDELLGAVDLGPVRATGDWRDRLAAVLTSYTTVLFEHPGLAQSALVARPSGGHYLDLIEALLGLLAEGDVPADQAAWGVDALMRYATATAAEHSGRDGAELDSRRSGSTYEPSAPRVAPTENWPDEIGDQHSGRGKAEDSGRGGGDRQVEWDALDSALISASPRTHPQIAALRPDLLSGEPRTRLAWGFRVLINGIAHTPRPGTEGAPA